MGKYLFMYTMGPVQSYIEQARKTHDLFAGSRILSRLSECGMKKVEESGGEIYFPAYKTDKDTKKVSYPNRFVALVDTENIGEFAKAIDDAVKGWFVELLPGEAKSADKVLSTDEVQSASEDNSAKSQIENHLQTFWTAVQYDEGNDCYKTKYIELENNMRSIKSSNTFSQIVLSSGENHRKCNLCGQRIALFDKTKNDKPNTFVKNESLCGVCYAKRVFSDEKENSRFPSTAEVALAHWKKALLSTKKGVELYSDYKGCFKESFSGQYFYNSGIVPENIEGGSSVYEARKKLKKINTYMKEKYPELIKRRYYAVIAFDGDDMGKWMSGAYFKEDVDFVSSQQTLSSLLGQYADWVHTYLKINVNDSINTDDKDKQLGSVVYAGGEDFFGLVPLDNLFDVLKTLRAKFKEMISDKLKNISDKEFTFSAGVCIAHYKSPLSAAVVEARAMEKKAKKFRDNKDAVAISILKRSGDINCTVFGWRHEYDGEKCYVTDSIKAISGMLNTGFSDKFLRNIVQTIYDIVEPGVSMNAVEGLILSDAYRFVERACIAEGEGRGKIIEQMKGHIEKLYTAFASFGTNDNLLYEFAHALLLAEFIRREQDDN